MKTTVIAFANQKGGVAKTTTVAELGDILSQHLGKKVLMVDMDPQSSLTQIRGDLPQLTRSAVPNMTQVMLRKASIREAIVPIKENLWLAPTTLELSDAELSLVQMTLRELVLRDALKTLMEDPDFHFDYILIDCPPSRGLLTVNALSAADEVVIPVQAEYQALLGRQLVKNTISQVQSQINKNLKIYGYVVTMTQHTLQSNEAYQVLEDDSIQILQTFPGRLKSPMPA
ncbi:ParA family protein [Lacticaseibacillus camelliae]|uniref:ParA family protein n=1 Tax=Lacticaseibacillus camelliae TaxID=381742 RepID=UPI000AF25AFB|nr:AAA family ATPase [Lacticaseibacillus camelliae]